MFFDSTGHKHITTCCKIIEMKSDINKIISETFKENIDWPHLIIVPTDLLLPFDVVTISPPVIQSITLPIFLTHN